MWSSTRPAWSVSGRLPGSDETGLRAVLPLAVHNTWVLLRDPRGPENLAEVLLLVSGTTDTTARERIFADIAQRLPELLNGLRLRAARAGRVPALVAAGEVASPFGDAAGGFSAAPAGGHDPFDFGGSEPSGGHDQHGGDTAVGHIPSTDSIAFEPIRTNLPPVPPGFHEAPTQERAIPDIPGLHKSQPESEATDHHHRSQPPASHTI